MILREMSMQIKYLSEDGVPKARIARQLGVSRQTVYNHLNREEVFPKVRAPRASKLDAYKGVIRTRLEQFDLPGTVLLRELRLQGYTGGITILREFMRPLKASLVRRVTERFETTPGRQAQMDWGECGTVQVGDERKKLYVFVLVLGYSRMMYATFTTSCRLPVLLGCMKEAFSILGIPREVLVDNMKQAVDTHDVVTGKVTWNRSFLDFAAHHGFLPVACPPYWPRVKGKVERGVGYLKASFLEGRTFTDLQDLNGQLQAWLDGVANTRVHGTTKARPVDRFSQEQAHLRPLGGVPDFDTRPVVLRLVPSDCHIHFKGVRYSVDPVAVGKTVSIRADGEDAGDAFAVYLDASQVARHRIRVAGSDPVMLPEHQEKIRRLTRGQAKPTARGARRNPHYVQAPVCARKSPSPLLEWLPPEVQVRPLAAYEHLLQEGVS